MFGEGPITICKNHVEFHNKHAHFSIDASLSGQHTVNWLILAIISFSYINTIYEIVFTPREYAGKDEDYPVKGKLITCQIPQLPPSDGSDCCLWHLGDSDLEELKKLWDKKKSSLKQSSTGSSQYEELLKEWDILWETLEKAHFKYIGSEDWSTDALGITIQLEEPFSRDSLRMDCLAILQKWLNAGMNGNFGPGFDHAIPPQYKEDHACITMWCDMGVSNPILALLDLAANLQKWKFLGTPIKSLKFEKAGADFS